MPTSGAVNIILDKNGNFVGQQVIPDLIIEGSHFSVFRKGLNEVGRGFKEVGQTWDEFFTGDSKDARVARKTIGGIVGLALTIPSAGSSLSWVGWGSIGYDSNSLFSGITDATDDQDAERNLLREGSLFIGGDIGAEIYDYSEFYFGLLTTGTGGYKSIKSFTRMDISDGLKEMFGVSKNIFELKPPTLKLRPNEKEEEGQ